MEILAGKEGLLYIQNMTTEVIYKIEIEEQSTFTDFKAFPSVENEDGDHVWADEPDYVSNDMYCLIEDMQEI